MTGLDRRQLGRTDVTVPSLCLGTMMYGDQISEKDAHRQMDRCFERGIDFLDTAEMYTIPPKPSTQGNSERIVGRWVNERGVRDRVVLATKIVGRSSMTHVRGGDRPRVTREQIHQAIDASLDRLGTDYVDLYQIHWPDRNAMIFGEELTGFHWHDTSDAVPIHEQLEVLSGLVKEGKIRFIGLSNETPWGVMQFLRAAEQHGLERIVSIQNAYSLLNRTFDQGLAEIAMQEQVGLLAYSPLAQGVLSGKYLGGKAPAGSRGAMFGRMGRYETPSAETALKAYLALADDLGVSPITLAMQFVTTRPFVTSNIFGASNDDQLDAIFESLEFPYTDEVAERVNAIHARQPNPCP